MTSTSRPRSLGREAALEHLGLQKVAFLGAARTAATMAGRAATSATRSVPLNAAFIGTGAASTAMSTPQNPFRGLLKGTIEGVGGMLGGAVGGAAGGGLLSLPTSIIGYEAGSRAAGALAERFLPGQALNTVVKQVAPGLRSLPAGV